jgi:hypothetical protein
MRSSDVISVGTFRTKAHAQKAKHILDQAGVESMMRRDAMTLDRLQDPTVNKRFSSYTDHVQLMVRGEDVDKALHALQRSN